MIVVRKVDLMLQGFILGFALLALILNRDYLYVIEPVIGFWQVFSALLNSHSMNHEGNNYRRRIYIYWILTVTALVSLWALKDVAFVLITNLCWGIAIYYWTIYLLFIQHLQYRKELSTVIRK